MKGMSYSQWLKWRMGGIGASEAPAVMNATPFSNPQKLWDLKTGRRAPEPVTYPMRRGIELEPKAREAYEAKTGIRMQTDVFLEHSNLRFIRASYDGINSYAERALEIKCPGRVDQAVAAQGKIPEKYLWQCVHLAMVSNLPHVDYWSFDGRDGILVRYKRDEKLETELIEAETIFWWHVMNDEPLKPERKKLPVLESSNVFRIRRSR